MARSSHPFLIATARLWGHVDLRPGTAVMGRGHPYWRSAFTHSGQLNPSAVPLAVSLPAGGYVAPLCQGCYLFSQCRHRGGAGGLGSPGSGCLTWAVLVEGAQRAQRRQVIVNAARGSGPERRLGAGDHLPIGRSHRAQPAVTLQPFRGQRRHRERSSLEGFGELAVLLHNQEDRVRSLAAKQRAVANSYIKGSDNSIPAVDTAHRRRQVLTTSQPATRPFRHARAWKVLGWRPGHDPLGTKSRSCLTPFPLGTGAPGTFI